MIPTSKNKTTLTTTKKQKVLGVHLHFVTKVILIVDLGTFSL